MTDKSEGIRIVPLGGGLVTPHADIHKAEPSNTVLLTVELNYSGPISPEVAAGLVRRELERARMFDRLINVEVPHAEPEVRCDCVIVKVWGSDT